MLKCSYSNLRADHDGGRRLTRDARVGHELGLYRTMASAGPATAAEIAAGAGCNPRLVAEWLDYHASSAVCSPNSLSQDPGAALGAQAGEARLRQVFEQAGYTRFRRATETPMNLVLEARR